MIGSPYVLSEQVEQELADMIRSYCSSGNVMEKEFFKEIVKKYAQLLLGKKSSNVPKNGSKVSCTQE